ncbi:hypothetical protein BDF22DRAFT_668800 [Syncephalis plumigaleata]|nr:hypothetical protein BDF22DRAFT_668800 [Syncephalis plumigaleata]
MARASLLFYIMALAQFFVHIHLTRAVLSYRLGDDKTRRCSTSEPYFGRPIPYKVSGVFILLERSKETPCSFTVSNNTLDWVDKYQLKSRYSHMILATEDTADSTLLCSNFFEAIKTMTKFGKSLENRGFPAMGGLLYFITRSTRKHVAPFSPEIGPAAVVDSMNYYKVKPLVSNTDEPIMITMEQGMIRSSRKLTNILVRIYRWCFVFIAMLLVIERALCLLRLLKSKRFYICSRNLAFLASLTAMTFLFINRSLHHIPFIGAILSKVAYIFYIISFYILLYVWTVLLASVHAVRIVTVFRVVIITGGILTISAYILEVGFWFSYSGFFRYWATQTCFFFTTTTHCIVTVIFGYCSVQFLLHQRRSVIKPTTRKALRVLSKAALLCFVAFILHCIGIMLDVHKVTSPTVIEIAITRIFLDIPDFLANFAILWVLGPQIAQNEDWAQTRLAFSSVVSQWLKRIRASNNDRNTLISSVRDYDDNNNNPHVTGDRTIVSNDIPIMSSHLSISSLEEEGS